MSKILQSIHVEAEFSQKGKQKKKCRQIKGSKDPDTDRNTYSSKQTQQKLSTNSHGFFFYNQCSKIDKT